MEVVAWRPPRDGGPGACRLVKRGTFVTGWAEFEVRPADGGNHDGSRVIWREDLSVRGLPGFADRPLGWSARWMFGRAMDGLLGRGESGRDEVRNGRARRWRRRRGGESGTAGR
jgi:hypothetical protein